MNNYTILHYAFICQKGMYTVYPIIHEYIKGLFTTMYIILLQCFLYSGLCTYNTYLVKGNIWQRQKTT